MGVTVPAQALSQLAAELETEVDGAPAADLTVAPRTLEEAARLLDLASAESLAVLVWGGGTHQGLGGRVRPDMVLATSRLDRVVDWQPDDLTVVVEAGVGVAALEERLAGKGQTAVLPERPGAATVGGVVAAGVSGWRRLRYGPTRNGVLEATIVTGDGRIVRGGGRVVKNVSGYDLPRLATGSLGSLGFIGQVALKLWPTGAAAATVRVDSAEVGLASSYRPLAVLEIDNIARVYLAGSAAEVEAQAETLGGDAVVGLDWPPPLTAPLVVWLRVPPSRTREAIERVPDGWSYQAAHGVGELRLGSAAVDLGACRELRTWAEGLGGSLVVAAAPDEVYDRFDPWGALPPGLGVARRLVARFDPVRVLNPGRPAGGL